MCSLDATSSLVHKWSRYLGLVAEILKTHVLLVLELFNHMGYAHSTCNLKKYKSINIKTTVHLEIYGLEESNFLLTFSRE